MKYKLFMLIFTKFKNSYFLGATLTASNFLNGLQGNPFNVGYTVFIDRPVLAFK